MNGLKHLFYRIIPIITLICFVSFGMLQIFNNETDLTYLDIEYYDKQTGIKYDNPTTQQKANSNKLYTFNLIKYTENIDQDILTRSINNTFNFQNYTWTVNYYKEIWKDGYQIFDGVKTIWNSIILVINSLIIPINVFITPIRITAGITLTAMSLLGINTNTENFINTTLNGILDYATIPLIPPAKSETTEDLNGKTYKFNSFIEPYAPFYEHVCNVKFHTGNNAWKKMTINVTGNYQNWTVTVIYTDLNDNNVTVFTDSNGWYNENYRTFTIDNSQTIQEEDYNELMYILGNWTTEITE